MRFFGICVLAFITSNAHAATLLISASADGRCEPLHPMADKGESLQLVLDAKYEKTVVLDFKKLDIHLRAIPGRPASKTFMPLQEGDFDFTCGEETLPESERGQGSLMVM